MKRTVILLLLLVMYYLIAYGQNTADSTIVLNEATVKSTAPMTKLRDDAIVTKVQGSALERTGSAYEMLGKVPGMMMQGEKLEVIGKGAPVYYVNGRKLYDIEELKRMRSEDVLEVEVINNPGAQYDATVRSVVRIRTRKPQGEGLGLGVTAGHNQDLRRAEFADPLATLTFNYRHKGLDFFGMVNNWNRHTLQYSTVDQHIFTKAGNTINENWQTGWADTHTSGHGMNYALGSNWMVSEKHSLGVRLQIDHMLSNESPLLLREDVYNNNAFYKTILSETFTQYNAPLGYSLNSYYNGKWGKIGIDWNFDWNTKGAKEDMNSVSDDVRSLSDAQSRLFATKLVVSFPLWNGMLNTGTEMGWANRNIDYTINQNYIADSHSKTQEDTYAAFVEYMAHFGKYGVAKVGARYESVLFDYRNLVNANANVCNTRHGLYPSLSYSVQLGKVGLALSYNTKTIRPNFYHLTDATTYASHSILLQGNSQLRNQIQHELGLNARWRWFLCSVSYTQCHHMISQWQYPFISEQVPAEEGVLVYRRVNLPKPVQSLIGYVNASPTFGLYTMNWTVGYQQQFLTLELNDPREANGKRTMSHNDPLFILNTNNTLRLPHNLQIECNLSLNSPGHVHNYRLMRWNAGLSASIQKTLLRNKALTLRLSANDILYRTGQDILMDSGDSQMYQCNRHSTQRLKFTIRYSFNQTKSKYKGTGAGKDAKDRM